MRTFNRGRRPKETVGMPKLKAGTIVPTDAENEAIQAGRTADPDAPEMTVADFARARPMRDVMPDVLVAMKRGGKAVQD